ncbi:MAG: heavy metal translocating P-type ATPase [Akkermansiaceae bacterium]
MYLSLGVNISHPEGITYTLLHSFLATVSLLVIILIGIPLLKSAWSSALNKSISLEHAFLMGILGSYTASIYSSLTGQGAVYYEVVIILMTIYFFGQTITAWQIQMGSDLAGSIPGLLGKATVIDNSGNETRIAIPELVSGQTIKVKEGEYIPVDGDVSSGSVYIEQQAHTGETFPQVKGKGDHVLAGGLVLDGELIIRSTSSGKTREVDRLLEKLCNAQESYMSDHNSGRLVQKILHYFVPAVLLTAIITGVTWTLLGKASEGWLYALTVTVVACPCALGVAIPLAIQRAHTSLKLLGITPKDSRFIDKLAHLQAVAFDKTGTLSSSKLELEAINFTKNAPPEIKSWLIHIQKSSVHPVARPFWRLKTDENHPVERLEVQTISGRGIIAKFWSQGQKQQLFIGNCQFAHDHGILIPDTSQDIRNIYIFNPYELWATASLHEHARQHTEKALNDLKQLNIPTYIFTGDTTIPQAYQKTHITSMVGLSSKEKAESIDHLNQITPMLYVGDGLNDCEGFLYADSSIALKSGSQSAQETAQAILLHDNLSVIPTAIAEIRNHVKQLHQLLLFSLCYNAIGISLACLGILNPIIAALLMFISSISVITWSAKHRNPIG